MVQNVTDSPIPVAPSINDGVKHPQDQTPPVSKLQQEGANGLTDPSAKVITQGTEASGAPAATVTADAITFQGSNEAATAQTESSSLTGSILHNAKLFGEGLVSGSVGNAINGVKQLYDHATGTEYKPTELFSNQQEVDNSWAGKIGEVVGTGADFAALTLASGGVATAAGLTGYAALAAGAGAAGLMDGGLFTPSNDSNLVSSRLENAAIAGVTGVAAIGAGAAVNAIADSITGSAASAAVKVGGNILSGAGTGVGTAEASSLASNGQLASADQLGLAIAVGVAGGALSAVHASVPETTKAAPSEAAPGALAPARSDAGEAVTPQAPSQAEAPKAATSVVPKTATEQSSTKSVGTDGPANNTDQPAGQQPGTTEASSTGNTAAASSGKGDNTFANVRSLTNPQKISQFAKDYYSQHPDLAIENLEFAKDSGLVVDGTDSAWSEAIASLKSEHPEPSQAKAPQSSTVGAPETATADAPKTAIDQGTTKSAGTEGPAETTDQPAGEQPPTTEALLARITAAAKAAKKDPDFYAVSTLNDPSEIGQFANNYYARDPNVALNNMEFALKYNLVAAESKPAWSQAINSLKSEYPDAGSENIQETALANKARPNGPGYPERAPVKPGSTFNNPDPNYNPPEYTAPSVIANDRTVNPKGWADPPDASQSKNAGDPNWGSFDNDVKVNKDNQPLNPHEVTGLSGRGLLGNWGANHAADPIVTRTGPDGDLQGALVVRGDSLRPGSNWKLALPGGMVDKGEMISTTRAREFEEEFGVKLDFKDATPIYQGYVVDPRNTDNAWMETDAAHLHLGDGSRIVPKAGDDAAAAKWVTLDDQTISDLYGDHAQLIGNAIARWSADTGNIVDSSGLVHTTSD